MTDPEEVQSELEQSAGAGRAGGDEGDEALPASEPARRRRWRRLAVGAAVGGALMALTLGAWALGHSNGGEGDPELTEAREVAARFAEAYLTFDAASVNEAGGTLRSLMTERFAEEFESSRLPTIEELFADTEVATIARTTDVFTTAEGAGGLRAIVFVDVDATGPDADQGLVNLSFVLEMVASDGEAWRVDAVGPIPAPEVVGGPGGPSGSTTVPSSPPTSGPSPTSAPSTPPTTE
jgi:hypothetical protein